MSSPVRNLVQWNSGFGHEKFVQAVSEEFKKTYGEFEEVEVTVSTGSRSSRRCSASDLVLTSDLSSGSTKPN